MPGNIIVDKSYAFAVGITRYCIEMQEQKKEYVLSHQLLKSGTSIGANIEESQGAISKAEFIAKIQISYKEAKETRFWLKLIRDAEVFQSSHSEQLLKDCDELIVILASILKSSKNNR